MQVVRLLTVSIMMMILGLGFYLPQKPRMTRMTDNIDLLCHHHTQCFTENNFKYAFHKKQNQ